MNEKNENVKLERLMKIKNKKKILIIIMLQTNKIKRNKRR